ncbi:IS630 family transposase [Limnospira platensis CENA597]|uniref:IS630 family transposase n=1 Tax=Limnospira platensis TaxID=118562 RepID=UPI003D6F60B4
MQPSCNQSRIKKARLHSQKKTVAYLERSPEARQEFQAKLAQYASKNRIFIDESGIDNRETYDYGWCEKGQRFIGNRPGKRSGRLSIIGALCEGEFFAPMVYQGHCTAQLIESWLAKFLLPNLEPGQVIIMDNAPFHNSRRIRELIEEAGCELLFLPTYSPDLNPIEHWWHKVKTAIRKELPIHQFDVHKAADAAFQYL